jgi:hypothetical protein
MEGVLLVAVCLLLAAVFGVAGISKLPSVSRARASIIGNRARAYTSQCQTGVATTSDRHHSRRILTVEKSLGLAALLVVAAGSVVPARVGHAQAPPVAAPLQNTRVEANPLQDALKKAIAAANPKAAPLATPVGPPIWEPNGTRNQTPKPVLAGAPAAVANFETHALGNQQANAAKGAMPTATQSASPTVREQAPPGQVPAEFSDGIAALQSASGALAKAGAKWGGHKQPAVRLVGQALQACGQTQTAGADTKSPPAEQTGAMSEALAQLNSAKSVFSKAQDAWGGRRDKVVSMIDRAITELLAGIDFAKSHNTY